MTPEHILQTHHDHVLYPWVAQNSVTNPIVIDRAEGVYFWDTNGKRYLDFSSQSVNMNIGHSHPKLLAALKRQTDQLSFANPTIATDIRAQAAAKLAEITPGDLTKTLFTLGGGEAVENAIKIARQYTGRHKIITRYRSYHGASLGAGTATGDPRRLYSENGVSGFVRVHDPYAYRCPFGYAPQGNPQVYIDHVIQTIEFEGPHTVAAILMESITGFNGMIIPPDGYWQALRAYADKHGILLICDEILVGFGRTGKMFGIDHYQVVPDIMVTAKGLTCGYVPMGAVTVRQAIADYFGDIPLGSGLTYSGYPLGCAAAVATMAIYEEEKLVENSRVLGDYMATQLQTIKARHPSVGDVRSLGLYGLIECVKDRETREPLVPWNASSAQMGAMGKISACLQQRGISTLVRWNWIFVAPPLCITKHQLDEGLTVIDDALVIADQAYTGSGVFPGVQTAAAAAATGADSVRVGNGENHRRIGLIGLGNIGGNMGINLLKQGFSLSVYDIDASKTDPLIAAGAHGCDSVSDLAGGADVIITSLPGPRQLESVMLGDTGVLAHGRQGLIWIDTGTNSIAVMNRISDGAAERGIASITAPVSGGVAAAEAGTLSIFVGGHQDTFKAIQPVLEAVGSQIYYVGNYINAPLIKLLINYLCLINAKAIGEVLAVGSEAGINLQQLATMVQSSTGNSWVMEKLVPSLLAGGAGPGFTLDLAYKDTQLINELNTLFATPLEFSDRLCEAFDQARSTYGGEKSFAQITHTAKQ
ncbi:MAG: aminotransferase class III-fold pyridoxal phosphate-dependent enzyme [Gammaproteobacteria bacterium]|nr:aminotransferase class III-fold pyridoxal phosphate-dependent enzyme [Rhizobiaceae bacterium]NKC13747.1 aminotransferase class III-fold pyridoxal phosphate-dependent enzyme [Gammaproteobacteria bacterium]